MPRLLVVLVVYAWCSPAALAHPPASLVMDSQGAVYYSDLSHVWVLQPDGTRHIAVRDVHTHELWLDAEDNLYGEDAANADERYRHRVWRLASDGTLTDVLPWREGHPSDYYDYGLARDGLGREYVLGRSPNRVDVWERGERVRSIELARNDVSPGWLIASPSGVTHFTMGADLWRWGPQDASPTRVASNLIERTDAFDFLQDRHALMGLWSAPDGAIYVSVFSGQMVKRIASDGTQTVAARSTGNWSPVSGLIAPDGAMWIQEFSSSNETRVRRIEVDGTETLFSSATDPASPTSSASRPRRLSPTSLGLAGAVVGLAVLAIAALTRARVRPQV